MFSFSFYRKIYNNLRRKNQKKINKKTIIINIQTYNQDGYTR